VIERVRNFTQGIAKRLLTEEVVADPDLCLNHMVVPPGGGIFNQQTTSNDYIVVLRGRLSLKLGSEQPAIYPSGSVISIPAYVPLEIENRAEEVLELFCLKAPSPERFETIRVLEQDTSYLSFCTYILFSCRVIDGNDTLTETQARSSFG
jgi:mannose-6-phosphate isomerase-like protein (cupin superfamily)